jgi:hypothetical protein
MQKKKFIRKRWEIQVNKIKDNNDRKSNTNEINTYAKSIGWSCYPKYIQGSRGITRYSELNISK